MRLMSVFLLAFSVSLFSSMKRNAGRFVKQTLSFLYSCVRVFVDVSISLARSVSKRGARTYLLEVKIRDRLLAHECAWARDDKRHIST